MKRPDTNEDKRNTLYLVKPGRGEWFGTAGQYVGETADGFIVLKVGDTVRGFKWADVEPVTFKETE